ncbi:peptidase dimerization domain-containing protein [Streptomyces sp. NPDC006602]|uniref:peptidase dimerization domain-containing protein n=1 Tax=Streptomyces sp. NPDC006602 TaxID=3364751 RepID=UPI0036AC7CFB
MGEAQDVGEGVVGEATVATLVCEAAAGPDGALKTARKGGGIFELTVDGVESHAGLDPERGASAVHALAELVTRIVALGSPELGTTVNVGEISGVTARNVVAGQARCGIDVRIAVPAEADRIDAAPAALRPSDPRVARPRPLPHRTDRGTAGSGDIGKHVAGT